MGHDDQNNGPLLFKKDETTLRSHSEYQHVSSKSHVEILKESLKENLEDTVNSTFGAFEKLNALSTHPVSETSTIPIIDLVTGVDQINSAIKRTGLYSHGFLEMLNHSEFIYKGESNCLVVFIPGFLNEDENIPHDVFRSLGEKWKISAWGDVLNDALIDFPHVNRGVYHWPSNTSKVLVSGIAKIITLLGLLGVVSVTPVIGPIVGILFGISIVFKMKKIFRSLFMDTQMKARVLSNTLIAYIKRHNAKVIILTHSLGGEIGIRTCEIMGKLSPRLRQDGACISSAIFMAPAVLEKRCNWDDIRSGIQNHCEVIFSKNDSVLKHVFRAGTLSVKYPIGYSGISDSVMRVEPQKTISTNLTKLPSGVDLGHGDYVKHFSEVLDASSTWDTIKKILRGSINTNPPSAGRGEE